MDQIYVANQSGSSEVDGETCVFVKGVTRVREGHPLLKQVPDYFEPVDEAVHYELEQATANPGEKRGQEPKDEAKEPTKPAEKPKKRAAKKSAKRSQKKQAK